MIKLVRKVRKKVKHKKYLGGNKMIGKVAHIGITVSNMENSIEFYKDLLGLEFQGQMIMQGEASDRLFDIKNCKVKVAYFNGSDKINSPPIELLEFGQNTNRDKNIELNRTSISEICFSVEDIDYVYSNLIDKGVVFLSEPQYFDLTDQGFGKSKAVYFKDPDGIVLELIQSL